MFLSWSYFFLGLVLLAVFLVYFILMKLPKMLDFTDDTKTYRKIVNTIFAFVLVVVIPLSAVHVGTKQEYLGRQNFDLTPQVVPDKIDGNVSATRDDIQNTFNSKLGETPK